VIAATIVLATGELALICAGVLALGVIVGACLVILGTEPSKCNECDFRAERESEFEIARRRRAEGAADSFELPHHGIVRAGERDA